MAASAFAGTEARMAGKVTDATTNQPIPNATITIMSTGSRNFKADFKTEKDGAYRILVIDGTLPYKITYSAPGYQPLEEDTKLKLGEVTMHDVQLTPAKAVAATAAAPEAKPDPAVAAYNTGAGLFNDGKYADAQAKFQEAVTAKPDLTAGWQALARTALLTKDYPKAIEAANKALAVDADDSEMYSVLYNAYTATGDTAKAAEAKKKMPADAAMLFNDAAKLINSGKDGDA
ncbi:MAG TPA: carboxypeptidase regulatory-like domain-containing protein, partial [Thermoanaerobaculia bacterium]|nr:carboxypeptidase regulatory-like domain-containing protein [Thermoanaerobaculia bacterium]